MLSDIPGIGPATIAKLEHAGIRTEKGLARATPERIATATGRTVEQATQWIADAKAMVQPTPVASTAPQPEDIPTEPGQRRPGNDGMRLAGDIFMGLNLGYLGLTVLGGIALYLFSLATDAGASGNTTPDGISESTWTQLLLWFTNIHNLVVFAVIPIAWVAMTHTGGWAGIRAVLGLHWSGRAAAIGVAIGIAMVVVFGGIAILLEQMGLVPDDAPIENVLSSLTWPLVIVTSLVAGFAEEIMFRGVLQKWLRWWGQGLVFGALHLGNAGLISFAVTAAIGVGFGYARHRGVSLWTLIVAHFVYDLILFSSVLLVPEAAGEPALLP